MKIILVLALLLSGCANVHIEDGRSVRMLPLDMINDCEFISIVGSSHDNPFVSEADNRMSVVSDMKNQAAQIGGDTLVMEWIMSDLGTAGQAQVYKCK